MFRSLFSLLQASRFAPNSSTNGSLEPATPTGADAQRIIDESLREMERVIARLDSAKASAEAERNESLTMLKSYKTAHQHLMERAKSLIQSGQNEAARSLLAEQQSLETVIASFERITGNMTQTVQKLIVQLDSMRIQREELKAQRTVLAAQLASAQSQEEFLEKLRASGASHELLEREAIHAELRSPTLGGEQDFSRLTADSALAALEHQIQQEMAEERAEKERMMNEASLKRFQTAFAHAEKIAPSPVTKDHSPKLSLHAASAVNAAEASSKERVMNDFFATSAVQKTVQQSTQQPAQQLEAQDTNVSTKTDAETNAVKTSEDRIKNFFLQTP
jgi:phage shock protein A